ncbi:MAG: hypothetical protein V3T95_02225, partial [Acidobacteriota bacterium]
INDGQDNQCPGEIGFGVVDEISGVDIPVQMDPQHLIWDVQGGATSYQVARSDSADFSAICANFITSDPFFDDPEITAPGTIRFYLVRALLTFLGSWGQDSDDMERIFSCGLETDCANGVDDDSDSATDCFDLDCTGDPSCP